MGLRPSGAGESFKTTAPAIFFAAVANISNNSLGATAFAPVLKCEVEQIKPFLARVIPT